MPFVFSPITQTDLVIAELPWEDTLEAIGDKDHYVDYQIAGKTYRVNIGAERLRIIKKSPVCACCGVRATDVSIDLDAQQTKEKGEPRYHVNFYARTGDHQSDKIHLVLMTRDHVKPRSKGGEENEANSQTLCFNCNALKDAADLDLEHMRKALFPAYRAYRSTIALNKTKELLQPYRHRIEGNRRGIININKGLEVVHDERRKDMEDKLARYQHELELLTKACDRIELEAQITGIVPEKVEL